MAWDYEALRSQEGCFTCKFYGGSYDAEAGVGECRRFPPPYPGDVDRDRFGDDWPLVRINQWCGEWQAAPDEEGYKRPWNYTIREGHRDIERKNGA